MHRRGRSRKRGRPKLLLENLLFLGYELLALLFTLLHQSHLVLLPLCGEQAEPLMLHGLTKSHLLGPLLTQKGQLLLDLHLCQNLLLPLLLQQLLLVLAAHRIQGYPSLLCFIKLLEEIFLVCCSLREEGKKPT